MKALSDMILQMADCGMDAGIILAAREKMSRVTPLVRDCGALCGAACCKTDEDGRGGMLLFPGEEACYRALPEGFMLRADDSVVPDGLLLTCEGTCARDTRPLACRVFPLMFVSKNGGDVRLDPRAWALCPLMNSGIEGLRGDFMSAARETARLLMMDSACAAFIRAQEDYVKELTRAPWDDGGMA
jgi:hypothetical protein